MSVENHGSTREVDAFACRVSTWSADDIVVWLKKYKWPGAHLFDKTGPEKLSVIEWMVDRSLFRFQPQAIPVFARLLALGLPLQNPEKDPARILFYARDISFCVPLLQQCGLDFSALGESGQGFLCFTLEYDVRTVGHPVIPENVAERQCMELLTVFAHGLVPDAARESGQAFLAHLARRTDPGLDPVRRFVDAMEVQTGLEYTLPEASAATAGRILRL